MTDTTPGATDSIVDVEGLRVGHHSRLDEDATVGVPGVPGRGAACGVTVVLAPDGAVAGVDVRGGGPGTRETDLLSPENSVRHAHAIVLSGGSVYGLAAADGVVRWLEEHGHGIEMGGEGLVVPIVPAAVIFDLPVGDWQTRPDSTFGYLAAAAASSTRCDTGSVGAGTGARAGAIKGGVGSASATISSGPADGVTVAALMVANPVGAVFDPGTGVPWGAGGDPGRFGLTAPRPADVDTAAELAAKGTVFNTTIGVVATDAALPKDACRRIAVAGHDGLARAIRPAHSPLDGDTIFAVATGTRPGGAEGAMPSAFAPDLAVRAAVCEVAAEVVERAVVKAILEATTVAGIPSYRDVFPSAFAGPG
ncbi:P1 family peptidase [Rhodococcus triatomae]|uniref:L-aminopeptidase/D-esterase n=1 Tax=Rhodococcus triatomae TaxID=300028 RepID=A0A1G8E272_9NOCA|nr:P1 family peptidase [Rhodococcus triatomae]QNG18294.1 P1 family peptidase [Rhodococcus triatomae]QNG22035.1 P1 family peptidase [Rhodococcus triatomae]SDH64062.1 L-aminopeptidase/D-esterase [Rhodococcus triatomae]